MHRSAVPLVLVALLATALPAPAGAEPWGWGVVSRSGRSLMTGCQSTLDDCAAATNTCVDRLSNCSSALTTASRTLRSDFGRQSDCVGSNAEQQSRLEDCLTEQLKQPGKLNDTNVSYGAVLAACRAYRAELASNCTASRQSASSQCVEDTAAQAAAAAQAVHAACAGDMLQIATGLTTAHNNGLGTAASTCTATSNALTNGFETRLGASAANKTAAEERCTADMGNATDALHNYTQSLATRLQECANQTTSDITALNSAKNQVIGDKNANLAALVNQSTTQASTISGLTCAASSLRADILRVNAKAASRLEECTREAATHQAALAAAYTDLQGNLSALNATELPLEALSSDNDVLINFTLPGMIANATASVTNCSTLAAAEQGLLQGQVSNMTVVRDQAVAAAAAAEANLTIQVNTTAELGTTKQAAGDLHTSLVTEASGAVTSQSIAEAGRNASANQLENKQGALSSTVADLQVATAAVEAQQLLVDGFNATVNQLTPLEHQCTEVALPTLIAQLANATADSNATLARLAAEKVVLEGDKVKLEGLNGRLKTTLRNLKVAIEAEDATMVTLHAHLQAAKDELNAINYPLQAADNAVTSAGGLPELTDTPDDAVHFHPTCSDSFNRAIVATTPVRPGNEPSCGPGGRGLFYAVGPFPQPGTLQMSTLGDNTCHSGSDTTLAVFGGTSSSRYCINANDDYNGFCSFLAYQVSASDVATGRVLLVRLGLFDGSRPAFGQDIAFTMSFTCAS
jgi:hypothetical protein